MSTANELLTDFFTANHKKYANCAGYFNTDGSFDFCFSANQRIPAAAYVLDHLKAKCLNERKTQIFTNIREDHWIRTYFKNVISIQSSQDLVRKCKIAGTDKKQGKCIDSSFDLNAGFHSDTPPLGGGLYEAAKNIKSQPTAGREKAMARVLRYYMLACYSLLALEKEVGYNGGNYVAALLVSDKGEILSYGINNGQSRASFHHAEVNMLLSYFSRNPGAKFPDKSIVFSTLTPCKQCTDYLIESRSQNSVIFFGQKDTGPSGSAGEAIGEAISDVTKPLHGSTISTSGIRKIQIDQSLNSCHSGDSSIASKIGKSGASATILQSAIDKFDHKLHKISERSTSTPEESEESIIKDKVLTYLGMFMLTINV